MRVILLLLISFSILRHGTEATKIVSLNDNWILEQEIVAHVPHFYSGLGIPKYRNPERTTEGNVDQATDNNVEDSTPINTEDTTEGTTLDFTTDGTTEEVTTEDSVQGIKITNITIPSGIYTDLENAGITESILYSYNDRDLREYANMSWIYSKSFSISADDINHDFVILTFHGLDTITKIYLNDQQLGNTDNMFRRFKFDVKSLLIEGENKLAIHFESPIKAAKRFFDESTRKIKPECPPDTYKGECHINFLRKMQASFAWDWGLAAPSMGIWKDVELELYDSLHFRDITYELKMITTSPDFDGSSEIQVEEPEQFWNIDFVVHVEAGEANMSFQGVLIYELVNVDGPFPLSFNIHTDEYGKAEIPINMKINKNSVNLWWPNGYGDQQLYTFRAKWEDVRVNGVNYYSRIFLVTEKEVNVGFRTVELVQDLMENGLSFYFKVNGIPIFMKGSNWIPSHILPEKSANENKIKELLQAARDAHMNMLRVWGGGVYESDYFYNLADRYGILIWQDMMFACAMYPTGNFLTSVRYEVRDQIKRIQHHPSIALFATNNENEVALRQNWYDTKGEYKEYAEEYIALYVSTIVDEIRKYDKNRKILVSSPSNGDWNKDRDIYGISMDPQSAHFGDIHFYPLNTNSWNPTTFHTARFASEYGFQSYPQGWKEVAREDESIMDLIHYRQHHPLNSTLITYLVQDNINVNFPSLDWEDQVYLSQLSQAIALKTETEVYRAGRGEFMYTMGALYWQLNDVWVAPSWSSIEYNGNFKIIQYWIESVFRPVTLITQVRLLNRLTIYAVSDEINVSPKQMSIKMNVYKWSGTEVVDTMSWTFVMKGNDVTLVDTIDLYKYMNDKGYDVYEYFMMFYLYEGSQNNSNSVAANFVFPGNYQYLKSMKEPNLSYEFTTNKCENDQHRISITIKIDSPALFVYIVLEHPVIKQYRLSKNGFIQVEPFITVQLTFNNPGCSSSVKADSLKIKTLNKYLM
ncbi:beta-mannosidase isoform X2 [Chironomus tepperi]